MVPVRFNPYYTVTPFKGLMKKMPKAQILYNDGSDLERAKNLQQMLMQ